MRPTVQAEAYGRHRTVPDRHRSVKCADAPSGGGGPLFECAARRLWTHGSHGSHGSHAPAASRHVSRSAAAPAATQPSGAAAVSRAIRVIKTHSVAARRPLRRRGAAGAVRFAAPPVSPRHSLPLRRRRGMAGAATGRRVAVQMWWHGRADDCRRFCAGPPTPDACPEQVRARDARVSLVSAAQGEDKVRRARRALAASPQQGD